MNRKTQTRLEAAAKITKAMAHATRLFIVEELSKGDRCVCELTEMIGADTSTVSKHLAVLKAAGVVKDRKVGSSVYYNLRCPCVLNFLDCVETVQRENIQEQQKLLK